MSKPASEVQVSYDLARENSDLTVVTIARVFENGCKVLAHLEGEDAEAFIDAWNSRSVNLLPEALAALELAKAHIDACDYDPEAIALAEHIEAILQKARQP